MQLSEHQSYWVNKNYPEDQWFWIFLLMSILVHFIIVAVVKNIQVDPLVSASSQAPNQAIKVSVSLLQSQHSAQPARSKSIIEAVKQKVPVQKQMKPHPVDVSHLVNSRPAKPLAKSPLTSQPVTAPQLSTQIQRGKGDQHTSTKQHYFSKLLTHIETYKYYPEAAHRRGLSGSIDISFTLLGDGEIKELVINGGPVLLQRAAKQSVQQALPMPLPPSDVGMPVQVSLVMQYQLR